MKKNEGYHLKAACRISGKRKPKPRKLREISVSRRLFSKNGRGTAIAKLTDAAIAIRVVLVTVLSQFFLFHIAS